MFKTREAATAWMLGLALSAASLDGAQAAEYWGVHTYAQGSINTGSFDQACSGPFSGGTCGGPPHTNTNVSSSVSHSEDLGLITTAAASASADLATGQLRAAATMEGPVVGGSAYGLAELADTLHFDVGSLTGVIPIGVIATVHGAFGANDVPGYGSLGAYGDGDFIVQMYDPFAEVLSYANAFYRSYTPTDTTDPLSVLYTQNAGTWSQLGPNRFAGIYYLDAAHPDMQLYMRLVAAANIGGAFSDFGHTAGLALDLPDGVTFTSDSGVFLTATTASAPEPAAWALMLLGFFGAGAAIRRQAIAA